MTRRYFDKLSNLTDKTDDHFSADDIRSIQNVLNTNQGEINKLKDYTFKDKCLFVFDNSENNAMEYISFDNYENIDREKSKNIRVNTQRKAIVLRRKEDGVLASKIIRPEDPIITNSVALLADHYIPDGARINYFVSLDGGNFSPIEANSYREKRFDKKGSCLAFVANMHPNSFGEFPEIYNVALVYYNEVIDRLYGLSDTDFKELSQPELGINEVYIIRDNDKKVTSILDNTSITRLGRREDGKVDSIVADSNDGVKELTTIIRSDVDGDEMVTKIVSERRKLENDEDKE